MDRSRTTRRNSNRLGLALAATVAALLSLAPLALAQLSAPDDQAARIAQLKLTSRRMMMQGAQSHIQDARAAEAWRRWKAAHPRARGGQRVRKASER